MNNSGWIKLHRTLLDNPVVMKDAEHLAIWTWLLLNATHNGTEVMFQGRRIRLNPGELTTGRKKIAEALHVSESKVQRVLKAFENEHQIEQRTDRQCRLISILKWSEYQEDEQRNEQQVNNDCTTSEQRVNTKQECKNERTKEDNRYSSSTREIVAYLNEMTGSHYKPGTRKTQDLIKARMNEGFTVDDFKVVIYKKTKEWKNDPKMVKFLRPETLFGNKFEGYLNQKERGRLDWIFEMGGSDDTELF